jgi:hypothetical protein
MPTILQITKAVNHLEEIMTAPELQNFIFTHMNSLVEAVSHNRIIVGPADSGAVVDIDHLIAARNGGSTIIFTHGNPEPTCGYIYGETPDSYDTRQNAYLEKLYNNFGVDSFVDGEPYHFYNQAYILVNNPFIAQGTTVNIAMTHSYRLALRSTVTIIANDPSQPAGPSNFYIARLVESGKGTVWYWNVGHFEYGKSALASMSAIEKRLAAKILS